MRDDAASIEAYAFKVTDLVKVNEGGLVFNMPDGSQYVLQLVTEDGTEIDVQLIKFNKMESCAPEECNNPKCPIHGSEV